MDEPTFVPNWKLMRKLPHIIREMQFKDCWEYTTSLNCAQAQREGVRPAGDFFGYIAHHPIYSYWANLSLVRVGTFEGTDLTKRTGFQYFQKFYCDWNVLKGVYRKQAIECFGKHARSMSLGLPEELSEWLYASPDLPSLRQAAITISDITIRGGHSEYAWRRSQILDVAHDNGFRP